MPNSDELIAILDRILNGSRDQSEIAQLRQWLKVGDTTLQFVSQNGKFNTNIGQVQGGEIHIGDRIYQVDIEALRELLQQPTIPLPDIDWHAVSQAMLEDQLRLTTNLLTSGEGISYRTEQVYVPLGLVERKRQTRRREDVLPEQGSLLYEETEITQRFEHEQFLDGVLRQGESPKSRGKRIAIIGEPGAGKTTLLQQIARWVSEQGEGAIAIWVSLADLRGQELEPYLLERWLQAVARKLGQAEASGQVKDAFVAQFQQGRVWLLLDGVDEMQVSSGNPLGEMERQVRMGGLLSQARIVLSCRLNLWDGDRNALDTFDTYRTLEFSYPQQVEQFVGQWFGALREGQGGQAERLCAALKAPGKERIRDLVKNPLRLTLLCFNWYLGEGTLPETKAGLYEQFVADFYEWKREQFPTTAEQRRQLNTALGELAREAIDKEATRFRLRHEFVCEFLGEPDEPDSLFRLALRLGWLNKVGVEAENPRKGVYAFFHPTFQEYFAALAIDDWHYFLNHIPENPRHPDANYRVFESQWKEVFLLWLGREPGNELDNQKEELLNTLINFKEDCGQVNLYSYQAELLAANGVSEFIDFSNASKVIEDILDKGIREIETFNNPVAASAREILQETHLILLSDTLIKLLYSEDTHTQYDAAKLASEVIVKTPQLIEALTKLIHTTEFRDTRCIAACSLLKADPDNPVAIDGLIALLDTEGQNSMAYIAARALGYAKAGNRQVIDALEDVIRRHLFNQERLIVIPDQEAAHFAAYSLLRLAPNNKLAKQTLQVLANIHWSSITRSMITQSLEKYGLPAPNSEIIDEEDIQDYLHEDISIRLSKLGVALNLNFIETVNSLVEIMCTDSNKSNRHSAAWCLEVVVNDNLPTAPIETYSQLVTALKFCRDNSLDKDESKITYISVGTQEPIVACYNGLWSISQRLPYAIFHEAWHGS
jgi:energy-coupling factor transporter ATP-binding protein EcfA2